MGKRIIGRIRFACCLMFFSFLLYSCTSFDPPPKPSRNLQIDEEVVVAEQTIPSSGGTIVVSSPGSAADGMEITVPPGSYADSRTFMISTAEITADKLGQYFNPITPVIQVENGGGYAETPMQVTIPVAIPEGEFPVGFFYNEISGALEGLPLLSYTPTSVTVLTRHFMSESAIRSDWDDMKGEPLAMNASANMLISTIKESLLESKPIISSGFSPGVDDWEFTNLGSYISPGGHCAGQSMTALWYYYEKKLNGESALFHRFDLLNDKLKPSFMWMDNPRGYRFSSVIQEDFNFDGWINSLWMQSFIPELTFKTFAAAMLVTGEPQSVLIRNSQGQGGHAMIVYKVDYKGGILHIADPNYPNNRHHSTGVESIRTINLENGSFKPYLIGLNAQSNSISMDQIGYAGKTSYIPWGQIGKRYNELIDSTIGSVNPNTFPAYTIWVKGENKQELYNNFISEKDTFRCYVECPTAEVGFNVAGVKRITHQMFDINGKMIAVYENNAENYTILKPGLNKIGFYIIGWKNGHLSSDGSTYNPLFIDFKWFDVNYSKLKIAPNPISSEPGAEVEMSAILSENLPANANYIWNFGDNTPEKTVVDNNVVTHTYKEEGTYQVRVKLYQGKTKLVAEATATAIILGKMGEPEITRISPDSAIGEQVVTIIGKNFGNEQYEGYVQIFYGEKVEIVSWSNEQIMIKIPLKAKDLISIAVIRKTPGDAYEVSCSFYGYKIYPDVMVTLKRVDKMGYVVGGTFINQYGNERDATAGAVYFDPNHMLKFNGLSFDYTGSDTLDRTSGEEIFYKYNIHLTVSGGGQSITGTLAYTGENRSISPTIYYNQEIEVVNMKLSGFTHERVEFAFTEAEGKSVISSFLDDGGWGWDKYVDFKTASGRIYFYQKTW
ncbi:MAG TPA: PKD domain-containing protein [Prolixibacteraceae bacterium]|nr:PKD domain-containing protein [Prolixibacteraceae bacterium]